MADVVPRIDRVRGYMSGLEIPAHADALAAFGPDFLTQAFHAFGSLPKDNAVAAIAEARIIGGGSTGQKMLLTVDYAKPDPALDRELFVKFSRDFNDIGRDNQGKYEMESEIRFAAISGKKAAVFPITIPHVFFADIEKETHTGLLITQKIAYGNGVIEPHREKGRDYLIDDPLPYYRLIFEALARIAATDCKGLLSPEVDEWLPFDATEQEGKTRCPYTAEALDQQITDFAAFADACGHLLPPELFAPEFVAMLRRDVPRILAHVQDVQDFLAGQPELIALIHWNGNIDNAWFWRDGGGALHCGLIDWGNVGRINFAFAMWGALSAADYRIWDRHIDELLEHFVTELHRQGGPKIEAEELHLHMDLYMALMVLRHWLYTPARVLAAEPNLAQATGRLDPMATENPKIRSTMENFRAVMTAWNRRDFGKSLDIALARMGKK